MTFLHFKTDFLLSCAQVMDLGLAHVRSRNALSIFPVCVFVTIWAVAIERLRARAAAERARPGAAAAGCGARRRRAASPGTATHVSASASASARGLAPWRRRRAKRTSHMRACTPHSCSAPPHCLPLPIQTSTSRNKFQSPRMYCVISLAPILDSP